jgi:hypothetical protein
MTFLLSLFGGRLAGIIGGVAVIGALLGGAYYIYHAGSQHGQAKVQALWTADSQSRTAAANKAKDEAAAKLAQQTHLTNEARDKYDSLKQTTAIAVASNNRQLDSLRSTNAALLAAATDPATTAARCGDYAAHASDVLGQCAARLVEVAKDADGCAAKLSAAQDWIRAVRQ